MRGIQRCDNTIVHWLCFVLLVLMSSCRLSFSQQPQPAAHIDNQRFTSILNELIKAAESNPRLKAADAQIQVSSASVPVKKTLDPPQLAVEFFQAPVASFPNPVKDQKEYDYSIQQMIPFPGKLSAMAGAEQKKTEMLKEDRKTQEQDIIRNVKALYFELYLKFRQIEINHETLMLVRTFVAIAQKQYGVGMGKQSDVLRAQTELSSLTNDSIVLFQQRKSIEGMLNTVCNRSVTTEIEYIPEIDLHIRNYNLNGLLAIAEKNRPELKSMQTGIEMQQTERSAAQKEYLPDFMIRGIYKQMTKSNDDWSLMIGATIPFAPWSIKKFSSGILRADANIRAAQGEKDNMKNMIASEVNDALLKLESSKERLKLSKETTIPQAQQTLESSLAAYRTGNQEFLMLIDIQRMLVMAKFDYHLAVMNLLDSQSQLERAVGLNMDVIDTSVEGGNY